ncbi:MAG: hypothetical protein AAGF89_00740 [Bacteroidota bacterium]
MPYTPLKISISTPCHEDWNGMHPVPGSMARHCDSCAKNVTDFTGFSDAQLHAYARENQGKLCGRFRPDQLGRPLRAMAAPTRNPLKVAAATAGLLLASAGLEGQASEPLPEKPTTEVASQEAKGVEISEVANSKAVKPLLTIRGNFSAVPTDVVANDSIPPPSKVGEIAIEEVIVGDIEVVETPDTFSKTPIFSAPTICQPAIMGIITYEPPQPTGMDWFLDSLKSVLPPDSRLPKDRTQHPRPRPNDVPEYLQALTVSPNPFVDQLRLEINTPQQRTLRLELLDPRGRMVAAETFWRLPAGYNVLIFKVKLRKLPYGIYYLRVTDEENHSVVRTLAH